MSSVNDVIQNGSSGLLVFFTATVNVTGPPACVRFVLSPTLLTEMLGATSTALLVTVQEAVSPTLKLIEAAAVGAPPFLAQIQPPFVYPAGPDSPNVYVPAENPDPLEANPSPLMLVGPPVVPIVKALGFAVPSLVYGFTLFTTFIRFKTGATSLFVMVHVAFPPFVIVPEHPGPRLLL